MLFYGCLNIVYKYFGSQLMPQRKTWSPQQDRILKYLKDERGEKKWSVIAKTMDTQFAIKGKTGKQCRQRYHNHLDESIVVTQWTKQEEQTLLQTHEIVGNKWSLIAQHLPGRSDNCVKNHFYSKLRKTVRKVNKISCEFYKKQVREIKMNLLYKIIQITQLRFKNDIKLNQDHIEQCREIKNQLFLFDNESEPTPQYCGKVKVLAQQINGLELKLKKNSRKWKEHKGSTQTNYSNTGEADLMFSSYKSKEERPLYQILKQVCEEIMLNNSQ